MDLDVALGLPPNRVLVVGAGKSGLGVARFCARRGAQVTVTDRLGADSLKEAIADPALRGVEWELCGHHEASFCGADLIVVSPGVPDLPELRAARARGVRVTGEIELAARFIEAPIVAVTGTNGKSTVTALCGEIAKQTGRPTFAGGNLGTPLIECVGTEAASARGIVVVELSSFQLETCERLHPRAAALLNLTPDHLDRYADLEAYGAAKLRIGQKMDRSDALVVNADDGWLPKAVARALPHARVLHYALAPRAGLSAFVDESELVLRREGGDFRFPASELQLIGRHNQSNALAAILLMSESGLCTDDQLARGLRAFSPLPHRMQLVGERRGVRFYDDSKATNVDSVVAGLDGFPTPYALIAGGRDKGGSYDPMVRAIRAGACRAVVLIGEAADRIADALGDAAPLERARTLEEAVARASARVSSGEAVVLSPACSSYDMFENYQHRGRAFVAAVEALPR
ncbi:MAG TPA: UDP-N-acetylmuramoyl-L-alanine--D-glutamate ligase [Polyangia bacterium]|jgi:UDP-N-acetylmuramoylalanine--D-glutamate ligase